MRLLWISLLFMPLLVNGQPSKVTYAYDDAGRLALVDYGNGQSVAYTYDKAGNLIRSEAKSSAAVRKSKDASKPSAEQSGQTKPAKKEK